MKMNNINVEINFDKAPEDLTLLEFIVLCVIVADKDRFYEVMEEFNTDVEGYVTRLESRLYIKHVEEGIELRKKTTDLFPEDKGVEFDDFWTAYHTITGLRPTDKEPARKYWKRMTIKEKNKAIEAIKPYFDSLNDKRFCKKARTYLGDKNYYDEFKPLTNVKGSGVFTLTGKD
jgi:hypothetical protein